MLLNKQELLSDDQTIAFAAGSAASTNIIDLGETGTPVGSSTALTRDIGPGTPIDLLIKITETVTSGGSATVQFRLQVDDNDSFSSATTVYDSGAIAYATLVQGYEIPIQYIPNGVNERYMRLYYTVATATTTAGKVTAGIVAGKQTRL